MIRRDERSQNKLQVNPLLLWLHMCSEDLTDREATDVRSSNTGSHHAGNLRKETSSLAKHFWPRRKGEEIACVVF